MGTGYSRRCTLKLFFSRPTCPGRVHPHRFWRVSWPSMFLPAPIGNNSPKSQELNFLPGWKITKHSSWQAVLPVICRPQVNPSIIRHTPTSNTTHPTPCPRPPESLSQPDSHQVIWLTNYRWAGSLWGVFGEVATVRSTKAPAWWFWPAWERRASHRPASSVNKDVSRWENFAASFDVKSLNGEQFSSIRRRYLSALCPRGKHKNRSVLPVAREQNLVR